MPPRYIADDCNVHADVKLEEPVRLYSQVTLSKSVYVGKFTYFGNRTRVYGPTEIGAYCSISRDAEIAPWNHPLDYLSCHPFQYNKSHFGSYPGYSDPPRVPNREKPRTTIGHDVWIGAKAFINSGVAVGTGAVIAASAVVVKDVAPYTVVGGAPARPIRKRFDEETIARLLASRWWEFDPGDLAGIDFTNVSLALDAIADLRANATNQFLAALSDVVSNDYSGSAKGIAWLKLPFAHANSALISQLRQVNVECNANNAFKEARGTLESGEYQIASASYDAVRRAARVTLRSEQGGVYSGPLGLRALKLRFASPIEGQRPSSSNES